MRLARFTRKDNPGNGQTGIQESQSCIPVDGRQAQQISRIRIVLFVTIADLCKR
jgi:hypothetical protein